MATSFPYPLYDVCSVANIPRRVLGTRVNPDSCRIRVDGQIRFEYGYVWTTTFLNPQTYNEHVNYVPLSQPSSVQILDSILSRDNLSLAANIKAWVLAAWRTAAPFSLD